MRNLKLSVWSDVSATGTGNCCKRIAEREVETHRMVHLGLLQSVRNFGSGQEFAR